MANVAFIGLGNMGGPMAMNLAKAGHNVNAFDLSKDALAQVEAAGARACASPREAIEGVLGAAETLHISRFSLSM